MVVFHVGLAVVLICVGSGNGCRINIHNGYCLLFIYYTIILYFITVSVLAPAN